ncbi:MAG: hypothetical protein R3F54_01275 [Alphaproteobacteria bacterium]
MAACQAADRLHDKTSKVEMPEVVRLRPLRWPTLAMLMDGSIVIRPSLSIGPLLIILAFTKPRQQLRRHSLVREMSLLDVISEMGNIAEYYRGNANCSLVGIWELFLRNLDFMLIEIKRRCPKGTGESFHAYPIRVRFLFSDLLQSFLRWR